MTYSLRMDFICATLTTTAYVAGQHLMLFINGTRLDRWLSAKVGDAWLLDLVPAWLGWLSNSQEQEYVWRQTGRCRSEITVVPMLVCPDDLDFSCTVVVCEVQYTDKAVLWQRIGIDITGFPGYIGREVKWLDNIPVLEFPREQYESCLNKFLTGQ